MGVVNVTPDSFSDGGAHYAPHKAIDHAAALLEAGADVLDIGGESSRPGASPVPVEEEWKRVQPIAREFGSQRDVLLSIDTVKYEVAARALESGFSVINDISGLVREPRLANLAAESGAGLILMHMRGDPGTMQSQTHYNDLIGEIRAFLEKQTALAIEQGVGQRQIAWDPGIGFSKTAEQNLTLLKYQQQLNPEYRPLLAGVSRKSFLGKITGNDVSERLISTAAAVAISAYQGAHIVRVHDVREMREVVDVAAAIQEETCSPRLPEIVPLDAHAKP